MKAKKGVAILFIALILFSFQGNIFGAINEKYQSGRTVVEDDLEQKSGDSDILDALAPFVYWVASTVENLVGKAFKGLTGSEMFPWADRVLFNTLPLLDINIFNPAPNSLFKTGGEDSKVTPLAKIVRNTYFTVLSIAVSFLTVVVGIAAAKLALSSIASEKAKYKEAITKWLFSIVLIFLMHNVISFIFWINEQMVEVASGMIDKAVLDGNLSLLQSAIDLEGTEMVELFTKANKSNLSSFTEEEVKFLNNNAELGAKFLYNDNYINSVLFDSLGEPSGWIEFWNGNGKDSLRALIRDMKIIQGENVNYHTFVSKGLNVDGTDDRYLEGAISINDFIYINDKLDNVTFNLLSDLYNYDLELIDGVDPAVANVVAFRQYHISSMILADSDQSNSTNFKKYVRAMIEINDSYNGNNNLGKNGSDFIAGLGNYFKKAAYTVPTDENGKALSWKRSKLTITGAILYAIFVFQSIFYFLAYLKRFFYIIILVIMAPVIVLLDFLRKAII